MMCQLSRLNWFRQVNQPRRTNQHLHKIVFKVCLWTIFMQLHMLLILILHAMLMSSFRMTSTFIMLILETLLTLHYLHKTSLLITHKHCMFAIVLLTTHFYMLISLQMTQHLRMSHIVLTSLHVPRTTSVPQAFSQALFQRNVLHCMTCYLYVARLMLWGRLSKPIQR